MRIAVDGLLRRIVPPRMLRLVEGFWIIPLFLSITGVLLALAIDAMPDRLARGVEGALPLRIGSEGGRMALSAIATGVMTVVGFVLSLTFVALSVTAQLLSPRILDYVIRQRAMQVLIGLAIATFLFCTITLAAASSEESWMFTLSVPLALVLAGATLLLVIVFAHSMTRVMRSEEMMVRLRDSYLQAVERLIQGPGGCHAIRDDEPERMIEIEFERGRPILADEGGYIGRIDHQGLVAFASREGLRIRLEIQENAHILPGMILARVLGAHDEARIGAAIRKMIVMTDRRETTTGADYEAHALEEAALRALSPSLNDPATAISCINTLFEGLARIAIEGRPPYRFANDQGELRLVTQERGVGPLLEGVVMPIAAAGRDSYRIARRIRDLTAHIETLAPDEETRRVARAFGMRLAALERQPDLGTPGASGTPVGLAR